MGIENLCEFAIGISAAKKFIVEEDYYICGKSSLRQCKNPEIYDSCPHFRENNYHNGLKKFLKNSTDK